MDRQEIKELVKKKYSEIALQETETSCCSSGCCSSEVYNIMSEDYSQVEGYNSDADLGLGCGLPTEFARIEKGDTVVDLGSGAGNDCFVARAETGEEGRVIGVDFSPEMITKAKSNAEKREFTNVNFRLGDIENMPVGGNFADVVISNCVLNLLPLKDKIFKEIFRVLKPGGTFCVSDIVIEGELPQTLREAAEMYVGCVAGAIPKNEYMVNIYSAGFSNVKIQKEKMIIIPDEILAKYLTEEELEKFKNSKLKILSITVTGEKSKEGCNCSSGSC